MLEITLATLVVIATLSLLFEYVDTSIGMGYGTTLTPVLLLMGFAPLDVVPAVLLGEMLGGFVGGFFHHRLGNVKLNFSQDKEVKGWVRMLGYVPRSLDSKTITMLAACGVVGALIAVLFAISIPTIALQTYIGAMVLTIGIIILVRRKRQMRLNWTRLLGVGLISSFNKGVSGGGYGPLVTGGQILSGREVRNTVGSTTIAEALVCVVAFTAYVVLRGDIVWVLAAATSVGAILSGPLAALTVKRINVDWLKLAVGVATCLLGVMTLARTFIF